MNYPNALKNQVTDAVDQQSWWQYSPLIVFLWDFNWNAVFSPSYLWLLQSQHCCELLTPHFLPTIKQILWMLLFNVARTLGHFWGHTARPSYDALLKHCVTWLMNPNLLLSLFFLRRLSFASRILHAILLHSSHRPKTPLLARPILESGQVTSFSVRLSLSPPPSLSLFSFSLVKLWSNARLILISNKATSFSCAAYTDIRVPIL